MHNAPPHTKKGRAVKDGPKRRRRTWRDRSDLKTQIMGDPPLKRERAAKRDRIIMREALA